MVVACCTPDLVLALPTAQILCSHQIRPGFASQALLKAPCIEQNTAKPLNDHFQGLPLFLG